MGLFRVTTKYWCAGATFTVNTNLAEATFDRVAPILARHIKGMRVPDAKRKLLGKGWWVEVITK